MRFEYSHSALILMVLCFCFSCTKTEVDPTKNISTSPILFYRIGQGATLTSMEQTSNGGNIMCGYEFAGGTKNTDGFLLKTDSKGAVQWKQTYGGPETDQFNKVLQTSDGGYIMTGTTNSYGNGATRGDYYNDSWVVKVDAHGNLLWQKTFGDIYTDDLYDVTEMADHSLVIVGFIAAPNNPNFSGYTAQSYIVKLDQNGNVLYNNVIVQLQKNYRSNFSGVVDIPGGFAVIGRVVKSSAVNDQSTFYPVVAGFGGANGHTLLWLKIDSGSGSAIVSRIINTGDGLITATQSNDTGGVIKIFKTDYKGTLLWSKNCKSSGANFLTCFSPNAKGGYLLGGYSYSNTYAASLPYLLSITAQGDVTYEADMPVNEYSLAIENATATSGGFNVGLAITSNVLNKGNQFGLAGIDKNGKLTDYGK